MCDNFVLVLIFFVATASGSEKMDFLQEIETMKCVAKGNNPHVVNMIGCVTIQEPLCLITEFVKHGDLLSYLQSIRKMVRMHVCVCMYMHEHVCIIGTINLEAGLWVLRYDNGLRYDNVVLASLWVSDHFSKYAVTPLKPNKNVPHASLITDEEIMLL